MEHPLLLNVLLDNSLLLLLVEHPLLLVLLENPLLLLLLEPTPVERVILLSVFTIQHDTVAAQAWNATTIGYRKWCVGINGTSKYIQCRSVL